jgi:hypothetical protein
MKVFIYKSKEALIEGIKAYKKTCKKKLLLMSTDTPSKKLFGFKDLEKENYWALPCHLAEDMELSTGEERAQLAEKLSTKSRKK